MHKWEKNWGWEMKGVPLSTILTAAEEDQRIFLFPFPIKVPPIKKQGYTPCCQEGPLFSYLLLAPQCWMEEAEIVVEFGASLLPGIFESSIIWCW